MKPIKCDGNIKKSPGPGGMNAELLNWDDRFYDFLKCVVTNVSVIEQNTEWKKLTLVHKGNNWR